MLYLLSEHAALAARRPRCRRLRYRRLLYLPPEHAALATATSTDRDGGNRKPPRVCICSAADDYGEERHAFLTALPQKLLAIIGCEHTLTILLDYFDGKISCADIAVLIGKDRTTAWRWIQRCIAKARQIALLAEATVAGLSRDGSGCTVSPRNAQVIIGADVWAASLFGFETRSPDRPTFEDCCAYIRLHKAALFGNEEVYLGVWFDDEAGEYCLDVTKLFPEQAAAMAFARANKQKSIKNLRTRQSVWLDEDQRKAA